MYGGDLRWRAVTLVYAYGVPVLSASRLLGVSERAIRRWYKQFMVEGHVLPSGKRARRATYPAEAVSFVAAYVNQHPCFFVEELQAELKTKFDHLRLPVSHATILRVLHLDLKLSRKVLERRAREAAPLEVATYRAKLASFYSYPEQLLFIDETAKKGVDAMRKYAWAPRGERAVVKVPFRKGNRLSVLAACDTKGFVAWTTTDGTFSRHNFHAAFLEKIVPLLNPWPLPRSIVVMDNARIHMYRELEEVVHRCGAILLFLPPYCPHLSPIEVMFGRLKLWLIRHANLAFPASPKFVLDVAMRECMRSDVVGENLFSHCGYGRGYLRQDVFECSIGRSESS